MVQIAHIEIKTLEQAEAIKAIAKALKVNLRLEDVHDTTDYLMASVRNKESIDLSLKQDANKEHILVRSEDL